MTYHGPERRSSVSISGPAGIRVVVVGRWAVLWVIVGAELGMIAGFWACAWIGR